MRTTRNLLLITATVLLANLWLLMVLILIIEPLPKASALTAQIFNEFSSTLRPESETFYYRFFVAMTLISQWLVVFLLRKKIATEQLSTIIKTRLIALSIGMTLSLVCAFKIIVYQPRHQLALIWLWILMIAIVLVQVFLGEIITCLKKVKVFAEKWLVVTWVRRMLIVLAVIMIMAMIMVPHINAVVARFYFGEQFHHNDSFVMGPALTVAQGLKPNVDIISQYGLGIGYVFSFLMKMCGGISYDNLLRVMTLIVSVYYIGWFLLLRCLFNSGLLAFAIVLLGIKWQMFHPGVYPFVFTYGSTTALRFFVDVIFFSGLYAYLTTQRQRWFYLAALIPGIQLWYVHSEGVYLFLAWCVFVVFSTRGIIQIIRAIVLPIIVALILAYGCVGNIVLQADFWGNMREFAQYFFSGFGVEPMTYNLVHREFGALLMGLLVPIVYVATLIATFWCRTILPNTRLMIVALAIYGLGLYHYFVTRSTLTSYEVGILPLTWIIGFWAALWIKQQRQDRQWNIKLIATTVIALCLGTTHLFISYPNYLNLSANPITDPLVAMPLKDGKPYFNHLFRDQVNVDLLSENEVKDDQALAAYYTQESHFTKDIQLIQKYTTLNQRVPIISSFEIKLLIDSQRSPYFYYFPLIISRPFGLPLLAKTSIYTQDQMSKTLTLLERDKPMYIFMEPIFTTRPLPPQLQVEFESLIILTNYVIKNYQPVDQGQYLVAYKRIN